jgi:hypothetical protein
MVRSTVVVWYVLRYTLPLLGIYMFDARLPKAGSVKRILARR